MQNTDTYPRELYLDKDKIYRCVFSKQEMDLFIAEGWKEAPNPDIVYRVHTAVGGGKPLRPMARITTEPMPESKPATAKG